MDIVKHKNDIIRLTAAIAGATAADVIATVKNDVAEFINILQAEPDTINQVLNSSGLPSVGKQAIIDQLQRVFGIGGGY